MVRVKICGITCPEDALAALRSGADALGFVFAESPRRVTPEQARAIVRRLPVLVTIVGVFVDAPTGLIEEVRDFCQLDAVQLSGEESEETVACLDGRVIKAVKVSEGLRPDPKAFLSATLLLDAYSPQVKG
ncbi:MAG: N-(5'-phosphoribosyl)anthranilate isomerase, partial [Deltaproteobacteria bacterium]|nr:N-(5'-phosphoribosyl)anthranilate isomerase [Deltaproteobacteria bacterium]